MFKKNFERLDDFVNDASFINWANHENQNDIDFWQNWLERNPSKLQMAMDAKNIINGIKFKEEPYLERTSLAWNTFINSVGLSDSPVVVRKSFNGLWAVLIGFIGFLFYLGFQIYLSSDLKVYETGYGEIMTINLPDGTIVDINANSKLSLNPEEPRKVSLEGEAYFKVEKKPSTHAKFFVKTKDLLVEVYGTYFNVNTKRDRTVVTLDEGIVELKMKNGLSKTMSPGDHISYSEHHDKTVKHIKLENTEIISSWKEGTLIFENVPLHLVFEKIEEVYGLQPNFLDTDSPNQRLSGGIPSKNLELSINAIEKSTNTLITIKEDELLIKMNHLLNN